MSWGNHHQPPSNYGDQQGQDPWGRTYQSNEPSGYVNNDPYATPYYNQQGLPFGQTYQGPYQAPPPYGQAWVNTYAYTAANPPRPNVGPVQALMLFFKNYAVFHGRASRAEYWWMYLWSFVATILLVIPLTVAILADPYASSPPPVAIVVGVLTLILSLGVLVPSISLQVRRLHDAGFSGFFSIFAYVPYLNYLTWLVPFVMSFFPSTPNGIKYDNANGTQPAAS